MWIRSGILAAALLSLAPAAQAQNNTAAGALIGGATGAIIGGAVTGRAGGAAAGAVIGGATGAIIGSQADRQQPRYLWGRDGRCYLQQPNGDLIRVSRANCG
ncbi:MULTISPECIES: glycine zipper domain-containing protein [unclassified Xanthobacter]|uniref:glycine zipper domain-containing protein n=1 Tax=unclassified Xanthobacter TaxID=2623496 RepID=UPI001EDE83B2|nr:MULTISPECIES: glycine zipper domain-containing protein [unclassified Xanthobacter]